VRRNSAAREAWLALPGWTLVAVVLTWPTLAHPASTVPADLGDPLLQAWQLAWGGHALTTQPLHPFDSNTFFPLRGTLGFSDSLLGFAPVAWIGSGPSAALVRYNIAFVFAGALCGWGAYLLARQLGVRRAGAVVAGAVLAAAPWRAAQAGHLQILSCGAVPLALALLARGHGLGPGGRTLSLARARPGTAAAGWLVAAWQVTLGFGVGLQWGYALGLVVAAAVVLWVRAGRPTPPARLVVADVVGGSVFLTVAALFALPYLAAAREHPESQRSLADLELFSPPLRGFWTAPDTNIVWGGRQAAYRATLAFPPEMTLALGAVAVTLATLGVIAGRQWTRRRRVVLAASLLTLLVFALGTHGPLGGRLTYLVLFQHAPGFEGIRTPGRLVVSATVVLALLAGLGASVAAGAAAAAGRRWRPGRTGAVASGALGVVLALAVLAEGADDLAHPAPAPAPALALRTGAGPLLVLPSDDGSDETTMWWTTDGFPAVANGTSGFVPSVTARLRGDALAFPAEPAVVALRGYGLRRVLVLLSRYDASSRQLLRTVALPAGVSRVDVPGEDALVFTL